MLEMMGQIDFHSSGRPGPVCGSMPVPGGFDLFDLFCMATSVGAFDGSHGMFEQSCITFWPFETLHTIDPDGRHI